VAIEARWVYVRHMVRLLRPLVYVLALMQVVSTPVLAAAIPAAYGAELPCPGDMAPAAGEDHCPCCPDGIGTIAGCLAACAGAAATPLDFLIPIGAQRVDPLQVLDVISKGDPSDPPLKPPPIL
jgi:hypothetical protein